MKRSKKPAMYVAVFAAAAAALVAITIAIGQWERLRILTFHWISDDKARLIERQRHNQKEIVGLASDMSLHFRLLVERRQLDGIPKDNAEFRRRLGETLAASIYGRSSTHLLDVWNRPYLLVLDDKLVIAIGSRGENGVWEWGGGDDFVANLDERTLTATRTALEKEDGGDEARSR